MLKASLSKLRKTVNRPLRNRHASFIVPFLICLAWGVAILCEGKAIQFECRPVKRLSTKDLKNLGLDVKKVDTLEEAYEKYKQKNIDDWENIRVPKPWELENNVK